MAQPLRYGEELRYLRGVQNRAAAEWILFMSNWEETPSNWQTMYWLGNASVSSWNSWKTWLGRGRSAMSSSSWTDCPGAPCPAYIFSCSIRIFSYKPSFLVCYSVFFFGFLFRHYWLSFSAGPSPVSLPWGNCVSSRRAVRLGSVQTAGSEQLV